MSNLDDLDEYKNDYKMFSEKADNCLKENSFREAVDFYEKTIDSINYLISLIKYKYYKLEEKEEEESCDEGHKIKEKLNDKVKWDDIAGLEKAKQIFKDTIILPIQFPQLFQGKLQPMKNILLYGPSGTGKSYLVKALANEANIPFFPVSSTDIISVYRGESEQLIKNLFDLASNKTPSIIFFDQIDSTLRKSIGEVSMKIMDKFLSQMKEIEKNNKNIYVIAATNFPWELNSIALKLFQKKIYIGLPDFEGRKLLFKINLSDIKNDLNDEQLDNISKLTEGYSGSDIYNLTQEAFYEPLRKKLRKEGEKEKNLDQVENNEIKESGMVTFEDLVFSLEIMKPTVRKVDLKKYKDFTEELGIEG